MPRASKAKASDPLKLWPEPDWLKAVAKDRRYDWARIAWRRAASQPGAWFDHR
jgi:hypothetical protein